MNSPPHRHDPFRALALTCIVLGMVIVIGAIIFWVIADRQSTTIMGAGVALALGGGIKEGLSRLAESLPNSLGVYVPPPEKIPEPHKRKPEDRSGS